MYHSTLSFLTVIEFFCHLLYSFVGSLYVIHKCFLIYYLEHYTPVKEDGCKEKSQSIQKRLSLETDHLTSVIIIMFYSGPEGIKVVTLGTREIGVRYFSLSITRSMGPI